jgi:hypothetical protein
MIQYCALNAEVRTFGLRVQETAILLRGRMNRGILPCNQ